MKTIWSRQISIVLSLIFTLCSQSSLPAESVRSKLVVAITEAVRSGKPIFDLACLDRMIARSWLPPKDGSSHIEIAFRTAKSGEAMVTRLVRSSGFALCDEAALRAILGKRFFYIPTGDAEVIFDFTITEGHPRGCSIVLPTSSDYLVPVTFVKSEYESIPGVNRADCFSHTELNNKGVIDILEGNLSAAEESFAEANRRDPVYKPSVYNLERIRSMKRAQ